MHTLVYICLPAYVSGALSASPALPCLPTWFSAYLPELDCLPVAVYGTGRLHVSAWLLSCLLCMMSNCLTAYIHICVKFMRGYFSDCLPA